MTVVDGKNRPARAPSRPFLRDIEPFFQGRPFIYVDIGAHTGDTFREIWQSGLQPKRAYLFEPNPASFARLTEIVQTLEAGGAAFCNNLALGAEAGRLRLYDDDTMTHVVGAAAGGEEPGQQHFVVEARRLDDLAAEFVTRHVSLLKIDVEGHESEVLAGAAGLLAAQDIDMVYIEVGFDPESKAQTYYRRVEDLLAGHGYQLFKIYEQKNEWLEDSPLLRRVNMAFMSRRFAEGTPFRLSKDLFALRQKQADLEARLDGRKEALETARARLAEADKAQKILREQLDEREKAQQVLRKQLDTEAQARSQSETAAAELQASVKELERKLEERSRSAEAAAEEAAAAKERLVRLESYGRSLETKYVNMLESESWRITAPVRSVMRRVSGKKAPAAFAPMLIDGHNRSQGSSGAPRPAPVSRRAVQKLSAMAAAATAKDFIRLAGKRDFAALLTKEAQFAVQESDQAFFLSRFCRLLALKRLSAFSEATHICDEIDDRLGKKHGWIAKFFGEQTYIRFIVDATTSLTRVGRYQDARRLLDGAIKRVDQRPALLLQRAEVCWPYAPEQAREDLDACLRVGALEGSYVLLQAYLATQSGGASEKSLPSGLPDHPQTLLIEAVASLACGDFVGYRSRLNAHFEGQGLLAPLPPQADRFAFNKLLQNERGDRAGPLVSIIMTTYNSEDTVDYAVDSLLRQTYGKLEIFIVDDGSTDATREKLARLQALDDRIRMMLNDENLGTYCSKNRAIAQATGKYITFHDSDDWAHPERVARHVTLMERSASLVASRSDWLRVEADGTLSFRRWGCKFQHPNPASVFIRRSVTDEIGFFDSVRYGADSEYWFRLIRYYGAGRVKSLPLCLGLGYVRSDSLTKSGSGAMDLENYSPIRGAYAASYMQWHAKAAVADLKLPVRAQRRAFWAPPEMVITGPDQLLSSTVPSVSVDAAASIDVPEFMFGISLASKRASANWARTEEVLGHTLRSLLNQSDPRFSVTICGHERPTIDEMGDPRIHFIECDRGPPAKPEGFRGDKMRKRRLIGSALRKKGGGYFFPLDADDLVHRDVVAHALNNDNQRGYLIEKGYALDYENHALAPIPGAWSVSFDRCCGSSAVIYFEQNELPVNGDLDSDLYFNLFQSHAYWPLVAEEYDRRLEPLPFAAGVYVVNNAQNLSFRLQRKGARTENITRSIARHRVDDGAAIMREEFGWHAN